MAASNGVVQSVRREVVAKVAEVRRVTPAAAQAAQRPSARVLQTGRAPAQLSLFLRPANAR